MLKFHSSSLLILMHRAMRQVLRRAIRWESNRCSNNNKYWTAGITSVLNNNSRWKSKSNYSSSNFKWNGKVMSCPLLCRVCHKMVLGWSHLVGYRALLNRDALHRIISRWRLIKIHRCRPTTKQSTARNSNNRIILIWLAQLIRHSKRIWWEKAYRTAMASLEQCTKVIRINLMRGCYSLLRQ